MKLSKKIKKFAKKKKWLGIAGLVAGSVITQIIEDKMMQAAVDDCVNERLSQLRIEQKDTVVEEEDD